MKILVDPTYNPAGKDITSSTKLAPGITCAKFLGALGSRTQFDRLYDDSFSGPIDRDQVARNLVLHANAMNMVISNSEFTQHRLVVSDGVYEPYQDFTSDGYKGERPTGFNDLRRTGRGIGYQLIDKHGKSDPRKTYDLAVFWKDYLDYDEIELAYDTFDPNDDLVTTILLSIPEVGRDFDVSFNYDINTTFNGTLQTQSELLEILPEE
jgi:hypothetical protein|tara:strand:+ start:10006 stop:10632 length:627 start_codon:yes stop_codon:yes gene_type:complete